MASGTHDGRLDAALGLVVRAKRGERDWTQRQLADAAGVHANVIGMIERGRASPRVATLSLVAGALGTQASELLALAERKLT